MRNRLDLGKYSLMVSKKARDHVSMVKTCIFWNGFHKAMNTQLAKTKSGNKAASLKAQMFGTRVYKLDRLQNEGPFAVYPIQRWRTISLLLDQKTTLSLVLLK